MGYEAMREETLARQKELGLVPEGNRAAADQPDRHRRDPHRPRRQAVPDDGHDEAVGLAVGRGEALFSRMAEVYAGFLAHADDQIGRLLGFLEEFG